MRRNLGSTTLRRKRRSVDPMGQYDNLPAPLRRWLSQAALPWSPTSARRLWDRACAQGLCTEDALHLLRQAEVKTLARDRRTPTRDSNPQF
ncbi:DUF6525 family protein [uncultured Roseobacter sp.]|uniref:DUF6525 family protein n=1 Tax=uncultured Roseobacter sp. TaxID=114847 RepID=UPI002607456E|nr:DUF6525 family protein [uncultured Roseobacter sp.]